MRALVAVCAVVLSWMTGAVAQAEAPHPPLEVYGELPSVRDMTLSPDGKLIAFITRSEGSDLITLYDRERGDLSHRVRLDNVSTRALRFGDGDHLLIFASDTTDEDYALHKFEFSAAASLDLNSNALTWLLRGMRGVYPYQTSLGHVIGREKGTGMVFMQAYMGERREHSSKDLLRVELKTGKGAVYKQGSGNTIDWAVDQDGNVIAREDYSNATNKYEIFSYLSGKKETILQVPGERPPYALIGAKSDLSALYIIPSDVEEDQYDELLELDFEGNITPAGLGRDGAYVESIYSDMNGLVSGVRYSGTLPSYHFFDPEVDQAVAALVGRFPTSAVFLTSWSDDWSQILYLIYDSGTTGQYVLQDRTTGQLMAIATRRKDIPSEAVGDITVVKYPARDGLSIPAVLTWPAGVDPSERWNLPLVVMPHGGPASYDYVTFDWMAQYFANRGYVVLQPNFRGSAGYGADFMKAGYGEWGRKMQDDVTDGVTTLITGGVVDPERVCIVGASYGGYSALAGGAYTPDMYSCVVAIAPVSDVSRMIENVAEERGRDHWAVAYWKELIGDPRAEKDKLAEISPVKAAAQFTAPVLLIHGEDDTVVPFDQSKIMQKALKRADKDVTLVKLKSEDHWLSDGDTRIEALRAMGAFVDEHIGQ